MNILKFSWFAAMAIGVLLGGRARATEPVTGVHDLSGDLPLILEDATPTETGQLQIQLPVRYENHGEGSAGLFTTPGLQYGLNPQLQLQLSAQFLGGSQSRKSSGDIQAQFLFSLIRDRVALEGGVEIPTGIDSETWSPLIKLILSQPLDPAQIHRAHLNLSLQHAFRPAIDERGNLLTGILGYTFSVSHDLLLAADFVRRQESELGNATTLWQTGLNYGSSEAWTWSLALGSVLGGNSPGFTGTFAVQFSTD